MSVQPISALTQNTTTSTYTDKAPGDMNKTDFLTLLIAQLQVQDPLNPQDPTEFTSQLTQFSSLEQMMGVKSSIDTMRQEFSDAITSLQMLQLSSNSTQAVAFIGKDVLYATDKMTVAGGHSADLQVQAPEDLHNVKVSLKNAAGDVVRTFDLGSVASGMHTYSYAALAGGLDGLSDGEYTVEIAGQDSTGTAANAVAVTQGRVQGIYFEGGVTYADIDGKRVALNEIYSVRAADAA